jgi:hypothetical protein
MNRHTHMPDKAAGNLNSESVDPATSETLANRGESGA